MSRRALVTVTALLALPALPALVAAQDVVGRTDSVITRTIPIDAGGTVTVRSLNGEIDIREGAAGRIELRAVKNPRRSRIEDHALEIRGTGGSVRICHVYDGESACEDRRHGTDVRGSMRFQLMVPPGVVVRASTGNGELSLNVAAASADLSTGNGEMRVSGVRGELRASTGNGELTIDRIGGPVRASTGNGRVDVTTESGPVNVSTGNGGIDVRMRTLRPGTTMEFSTGSGSVRITLPPDFSGEVDASTGNGSVQSDFPIQIEGRLNPRRLRGRIGNGDARLELHTGNGSIDIRKG